MEKHKKIDIEDVSKEEIFDNLQRCISEKIDYWNRINKAIEYIKEYCIDDEFYINLTKKEKCIFDVLAILKGKDNESNRFIK